MSTVLTGNAAHVTTPLTATIVSIADNGSGAARLATAAPHLFGSSDSIQIAAGPISGTFVISVIDATHFDAVGSTFTVTATGVAVDLSITPQVLVPTDGDPLSAQISGLLSGFQAVLDRTQYLAGQVRASNATTLARTNASQNWQPAFTWTSPAGPYLLCWDDFNSATDAGSQRWLLGSFSAGGSPVVEIFYGSGTDPATSNWTQLGGNIASQEPPTGMCLDSAGTVWVSIAGGGGANTAQAWSCPSGGSFALVSNIGVTACTDFQIVAVGAQTIGAYGSSTAGDAELRQVSPVSSLFGGLTAGAWILKSNGSYALAIPKVAGGGNAYVSPTGATWTSTALSGVIGGANTPIDAAWNPSLLVWCLAVAVSGGGTKFFTSSDGQSWVASSATLASAPFTSGSLAMASVAGRFVALGYNSGTETSQVVYSDDAIHWYGTQAFLYSGIAAVPVIASSPTQLAACAAIPRTVTSGTQPVRFSLQAGLPTAPLP